MKLFAGLALGGAIVFMAAAPAGAATPAPAAPSAGDVTAARQVTSAASPTLARFFAARGGRAQVSAAAAEGMAPRLTGPTVPVYELNPAFVTGRSDTIATLSFLATEAVSADGQHASVWTVRKGGSWRLANIASGAEEESYARNGGTVFREPQVNAWYTLRDGQVRPLNTEARTMTGGSPVTLAAYQRAVQKRYGDRMPGSAYDRQGVAGGFTPEARNGSRDGGSGPGTAPVLLGGLTVLAGGGLALRRFARR